MDIKLGNLYVNQIENKLGIKFPKETREFMKKSHQPNTTKLKKGQWHCFDIPFELVCGDKETAEKIFYSIEDQADKCKTSLKISIPK